MSQMPSWFNAVREITILNDKIVSLVLGFEFILIITTIFTVDWFTIILF